MPLVAVVPALELHRCSAHEILSPLRYHAKALLRKRATGVRADFVCAYGGLDGGFCGALEETEDFGALLTVPVGLRGVDVGAACLVRGGGIVRDCLVEFVLRCVERVVASYGA